ncbi:hypothetical protein K1719_010591 [Acacia pycnantha]|nr:hypothetical protein K1719_010591 [Acacia pycnantha]
MADQAIMDDQAITADQAASLPTLGQSASASVTNKASSVVAGKRKAMKQRSKVWDHFSKFVNEKGDIKGKCNSCEAVLACDPKNNGTTALNNHFANVCKKKPLPEELKQGHLNYSVEGDKFNLVNWKFDQDEIPDKDLDCELYELVGSYMVHGPCGQSSNNAPCMKDGKCSKRNDGRTVSRKGVHLDNRFVVPYNARLLKLFSAHLNIEKTNQSRAIKYLFKYISKGNDRVIAGIYSNNNNPGSQQIFDEISHYLNCREKRIWKHRERGFSVGRLGHSTPAQGELYYLHLLLAKVRCPKNYEDVRTVNHVFYPTFREACYALGLLDDNEYIDAIKEAALWASGNYLRKFFTSMLLSHSLSQPGIVWEKTKDIICEDLLYVTKANQLFKGLQFSSTHKEAVGLLEIEKLLLRNGKSLNDYPSLPKPNEENLINMSNQLILQELNYNKEKENDEAIRLQNLMTDEQKEVFHKILSSVSSRKGGFFFLHGFGGTGKTFIWNALTASIRSNGGIILNVASSGIAATLLPSGRTTHSRFLIPIDINEDSEGTRLQYPENSGIMYSPQRSFARGRSASSSDTERSIPEAKGLEASLLQLIQDHSNTSLLLRQQTEKAKKEAIIKATRVSDLLVETVNGGVQECYVIEKRIEQEIRALSTSITRFTKQTDQWLATTHGLNTAVKEIGDFENWMKVMEYDCKSITSAIHNIHQE